jgi:hypothetical protein
MSMLALVPTVTAYGTIYDSRGLDMLMLWTEVEWHINAAAKSDCPARDSRHRQAETRAKSAVNHI